MERALHPDIEAVAPRPLDDRTRRGPATWLRPGFAIAAVVLLAAVVGLVVWSRTSSNRGTALSGIRTIAVLPMSDPPGSRIPPEVAAGLTEELISALGQVHVLTVKLGSSLGSIEGKPDKEIAQALDVDALLKTTVSGSDGRAGTPGIKVRARLLAAGTQGLVWEQDFEKPRGDSTALANAIAVAVTRAVKGVMTPAESARLTSVRQTKPGAEDAYLAGRAYIEGYGGGRADAALNAFQRALQLDGDHAGAHAGAARAYVNLGANGAIPNAQARAEALREARRSLDLDPNLPEAHTVLAHILFVYDWDGPGAEREFRRSLDLNPDSRYALAYYANFLAAQGRFEESLAHADTARRLDPQSGEAARNYALFLYYKRDYAAADQALLESAAIESNQPDLLVLRARFAEARGDFSGALADTREALKLSKGPVVQLQVAEVRRAALAGQKAEALARFAALQREADTRKIRLNVRDLAYIQLALGNKAKAIELFEEAVTQGDPTLVWLGVDPRVDGLRGEPRFRALLKTIGFPPGVVDPR
jgi:tetratricopeptide (TPR) repeat protein